MNRYRFCDIIKLIVSKHNYRQINGNIIAEYTEVKMPADKKKTKNANQKQSAAQRKAPASRNSAPNRDDDRQMRVQVKRKSGRSTAKKILPYFFLVFALILSIFFITVKLLQIDDGVGVLGYWIQNIFCGLLGSAAFGLPLVLGYIGVKWCIHNVRWKDSAMNEGSPDHPEYRRSKKRLINQAIMASLVILTFSIILGVFANYDEVDIVEMWVDSAEDSIGGGIIGSSIGALMVLCFQQLVSLIILFILLIMFVIFALGFTPNYIIEKISERNQIRKEEREEEKASAAFVSPKSAKAQYYDDDEEDAKRRNRMAAARVRNEEQEHDNSHSNKRETQKTESMSVDEMFEDYPIYEDTELAPPMDLPETEHEVKIGPSEDELAKTKTKLPAEAIDLDDDALPSENDEPLDFGDEPAFDTSEFTSLNDVLNNVAKNAPKKKETPITRESEDIAEELDLNRIENDELLSDMAAVAPDETDGEPEEEPDLVMPYVFPPFDLLTENQNKTETDCSEELKENARNLVETLKHFRVGIKEITYSRGPTITRYELKPEVGIRVRAIANLVDDIALSLATSGVRIEAPIPGKPAVGIEVPNRTRATVYLRDLIESPKFTESKSKLTSCLGMDVGGNPIYFDIGKMPHLLIAGTTGSGKSICINCIIVSMLYKAKPDELKLILIDPKKVEFNMYKNIPHLYCPIVSEPKKAAGALASAVGEMERRFELIEKAGVRDIASYNAAAENDASMEFMPHMVIIIDELADLMMTARDEVEGSICRIAQKARAAGIHMILGTQRPSVDVITGLIKANVPSRIACTVMSQVDSRTIIDVAGAENLIGRGDMLFAPVGASKPMRVQGAFVSEVEIDKIVSFVKENNGQAKYNTAFINKIEEEAAKCGMGKKSSSSSFESSSSGDSDGGDSKFRDAVKLAVEEGKISTSLMQRRLGVGYGRAAKIIDTMEELGYVSKADGNKPRRVILTMDEYMRRVDNGTLENASGDSEE